MERDNFDMQNIEMMINETNNMNRMQEEAKKFQKALIDIGHIPEQNKLLKQQIEDNKKSANEQIEQLKTIIQENKDSSDKQDGANRYMIWIPIVIAIISIFMSIYASRQNTAQTKEIYQKENIASNQKHTELIKAIENINTEKQVIVLSQLLTLMQNLDKKIVEDIDLNKTKTNKGIK